MVFYGTMDGWFRAVDARSGKFFGKSKLASGIMGDPMTFIGPDGKQYVAIYAGIGGWMGAVALPTRFNRRRMRRSARDRRHEENQDDDISGRCALCLHLLKSLLIFMLA